MQYLPFHLERQGQEYEAGKVCDYSGCEYRETELGPDYIELPYGGKDYRNRMGCEKRCIKQLAYVVVGPEKRVYKLSRCSRQKECKKR